jgi:hypothetical protein
LKQLSYVVAVDRKDGNTAYLRTMSSASSRTASNNGLVSDPAQARQFAVDDPKEDIIYWMDYERPKITKWANVDSLRIMLYECTVTPVSADDIEWRTILQRTAVEKLSNLEIEALGLEKYEIERRLSK